MFKAGLNETCEALKAVRIDGGTTCHQPLPGRAMAPDRHSPSPGGVCEASSTRSRSRQDRVDAGVAERTRHAYQWSSDMPPRTSGSEEFWSGGGPSRMLTKLGAGIWRTGGAFGSPVHTPVCARIADK